MLSRLWTITQALMVPALTACLFAGVIYLALFTDAPRATSAEPAAVQGAKPRPKAPDLVGGIAWLNTEKPISMADLKGRIVVLDFWTLCCINCIHTLPDLAQIEARYPGMVVVIGVHSPKFENEKNTESIKKAILRYEIKHPVVNDADHKIWRAYGVNSWPTLCLIDPDGNFYGAASGEGNLELVELHIKKLIKEFEDKGTLKKTPFEFKLFNEKVASPLFFPGKVIADAASKRLFIADSTNHRIVITNLEGKKIAIAGTGKEGMKDGKFSEATFSDPQGMALDGDTLYVADRKNHSIRALNLKDETVKLAAGTGQQDRNGRNAKGPALTIGLNSPWDLLIHNKTMYLANAGFHQIWTMDLTKQTIENYAGSGLEDIIDGPLKGPLNRVTSAFAQPSGLATDGKQLFVADSETSSIRALPLVNHKGPVSTVVGEGLFEFGDKNGTGAEVRLQHALGVAYLDGKLYVADTYNSKIKLIDPVKKSCETYLGEGKEKLFNEPGGVSISAGKMYVADTNNHRIQIVDMKTKEVSTLKLSDVPSVPRESAVSKKEMKK
jgi:thiol-disulfide isomerase/thioredoxin